MAFSSDGRRIVVANSDMTARVWDTKTGYPVAPPLRHSGVVAYATFSHNGCYVATASRDKTGRVWDASTGQPITPPLRLDGAVDCVRFSPDDEVVTLVGHGNASGLVASWKLVSDNRPTEELLLLARSLSLRRLDASGVPIRLDFETATNASWTLHQR